MDVDKSKPEYQEGMVVDDLKDAEKQVEEAGGKYLMGRPDGDAPNTFYEEKFRDPTGVKFDISHLGWRREAAE